MSQSEQSAALTPFRLMSRSPFHNDPQMFSGWVEIFWKLQSKCSSVVFFKVTRWRLKTASRLKVGQTNFVQCPSRPVETNFLWKKKKAERLLGRRWKSRWSTPANQRLIDWKVKWEGGLQTLWSQSCSGRRPISTSVWSFSRLNSEWICPAWS